MNVSVAEFYKSFEPRLRYSDEIRRLLEELPDSLLQGLGRVILRDSASLTRRERLTTVRNGRTASAAKGLYHASRPGSRAFIELFVDNILRDRSRWAGRLPIIRHEIVLKVFFHELGHHVYALKHPHQPQNEREATEIGAELHRSSFRRRYRVLLPLFWLVYRLSRAMQTQ